MIALPPRLLALLRDPHDLGEFRVDGDSLLNQAGQRRFSIVDSIPVFVEPSELGPQNRKYQRMYDWMSRIYDSAQTVGDFFYRGRFARARRRLAALLDLHPGNRCLYTSVGTGVDLRYLEERVPFGTIEFVGLDISMGMLRRCQKRLRAHADTSLLVQANAERLPFADRSFDVVFQVGGINFFDEPAVAVREMLRVAKPGALVLIADETTVVVKENYQRNPFTRRYFKDAPADFDPRKWVPDGVASIGYEELLDGKVYCLTFHAAARESPGVAD